MFKYAFWIIVCLMWVAPYTGYTNVSIYNNSESVYIDLRIDLKGNQAHLLRQSLTRKKDQQISGSNSLKSLNTKHYFAASQLLIVGIDKTGEEIYQTTVKDLGLLRAEIFNPEDGTIEKNELFYRDTRIQVSLPYSDKINRVHIFRWHSADKKILIGDFLINKTEQMDKHTDNNLIQRKQAPYHYETIVNNGDPSNRIDIVILGDGYTTSELEQYAQDVETVVTGYFSVEPFLEYQNYFNVHRIDVISNESGADYPSKDAYRNTALDGFYECGGFEHVICVDDFKAFSITNNTLPANAVDTILVIVNDEAYGGSGGGISVISTHSLTVDLALHEIGHSFGLLADEYGGTDDPSCLASEEPVSENITINTDRNTIKWAHWIDAATAIPTSASVGNGIPGLFEGGGYCDYDVYRPTYESMMRYLGSPFEQINEELLVKRIYDYVSLVDAYAPQESTLELNQADLQLFSITSLNNLSNSIQVDWQVDGNSMATGNHFWLVANKLSVGLHTIKAVISDNTKKVIKDSNNKLHDSQSWAVNITSSNHLPIPMYDSTAASAVLPLIDTGDNKLYSGVLLLVDNKQFIFELQNLQSSNITVDENDEIAVYASDTLSIPRITVGTMDYAVDLVLIQSSPVQFKLKSIQAYN